MLFALTTIVTGAAVFDFRSILDPCNNPDYDFFCPVGDWFSVADGLAVSGSGADGRKLFAPNPLNDYRLSVDARLGDAPGGGGGYGVQFDTVLLDPGTGVLLEDGYIFQMDRGWGSSGAFVLRRRFDNAGAQGDQFISAVSAPAGFDWSQPYQVNIAVNGAGAARQASIQISGATQQLSVFENISLTTSPPAGDAVVGIRSWGTGNTNPTVIQQIQSQPL